MSRGRTLAAKRKDWYWEEKERTRGRIQAEQEMARRKPFFDRLTDYIEKKLMETDPIDLIAIGGLTIILQPMVLSSEQFIAYQKKFGTAKLVSAEVSNLLGDQSQLRSILKDLQSKTGATVTGNETGDVLLSWLISFCMAAIFVKYAPKMLTGATGIAEMFTSGPLLGALLSVV